MDSHKTKSYNSGFILPIDRVENCYNTYITLKQAISRRKIMWNFFVFVKKLGDLQFSSGTGRLFVVQFSSSLILFPL